MKTGRTRLVSHPIKDKAKGGGSGESGFDLPRRGVFYPWQLRVVWALRSD